MPEQTAHFIGPHLKNEVERLVKLIQGENAGNTQGSAPNISQSSSSLVDFKHLRIPNFPDNPKKDVELFRTWVIQLQNVMEQKPAWRGITDFISK